VLGDVRFVGEGYSASARLDRDVGVSAPKEDMTEISAMELKTNGTDISLDAEVAVITTFVWSA
jgi:hypothetical protein